MHPVGGQLAFQFGAVSDSSNSCFIWGDYVTVYIVVTVNRVSRNILRAAALLAVSALVVSIVGAQQPEVWKDPGVAMEKRAADLLSRLTLEEKISQMMNDSPAIARLGIPAYNWWNESLHGVARAGLATA